MSVEWHYQDGGKTHGPVSDRTLSELAGQGLVMPATPVRRTAGDRVSGWRRAGAVRGLFSGDVSGQIGDPICENCGTLLTRNNECPACLPPPTSMSNAHVGPVTKAGRQFIVTTGDLREPYEIIGPVFYQISSRTTTAIELAALVKRHVAAHELQRARSLMSQPKIDWAHAMGESIATQSALDQASFVAVQELKQRAATLGGDAIIGLRQDFALDSMSSQLFFLQMFGTAVKIR
jgi:uncharacterized protein YbjQ (UPF0145 family)